MCAAQPPPHAACKCPHRCSAAAVLLQEELGIKRQDHARRIVQHITAKFDGDLHSRLQEFEGVPLLDVSSTTPLTLCVEGNISAGKSTFLQYITNNNEELQQQLGVGTALGSLQQRQWMVLA